MIKIFIHNFEEDSKFTAKPTALAMLYLGTALLLAKGKCQCV